jgi:hypothetical protein
MNVTDDWAPGPNRGAPIKWSMTNLLWLGLQIVSRELEAGETLEGIANGFFQPPRLVDYSPSLRRLKCPLIIAVTPRRILMFELDAGMTVIQSRFIGYDEIQYLSPPKQGVFGTSGCLRFGLTSGLQYSVGFLGPLFSDEGMRQEQRLAAYLREIATRFPSSAPQAHLKICAQFNDNSTAPPWKHPAIPSSWKRSASCRRWMRCRC